jgi:hypothetical protein
VQVQVEQSEQVDVDVVTTTRREKEESKMSGQVGDKFAVAVPQGAPVQQIIDQRVAMRGMAPGGEYKQEKYCGWMTVVVGVLCCPCVCFCPFDSREVYIEPGTGRRAVLGN